MLMNQDCFTISEGYSLIPIEGHDFKFLCLAKNQSINDRLLEKQGEPIKPDTDFTRNKTLSGPFINMAFGSQ